jgi:hypothetical protein
MREPDANTSPSMCGHARVTSLHQIPSVCATIVPAKTRPCPRFPRLHENGKEGVNGSSPLEGLFWLNHAVYRVSRMDENRARVASCLATRPARIAFRWGLSRCSTACWEAASGAGDHRQQQAQVPAPPDRSESE